MLSSGSTPACAIASQTAMLTGRYAHGCLHNKRTFEVHTPDECRDVVRDGRHVCIRNVPSSDGPGNGNGEKSPTRSTGEIHEILGVKPGLVVHAILRMRAPLRAREMLTVVQSTHLKPCSLEVQLSDLAAIASPQQPASPARQPQ